MADIKINRNKRIHKVEEYPTLTEEEKKKRYPYFLLELQLVVFRHLRNITVKFKSPITVISGSNKTGKSSLLLAIGCSHYNFMTKSPVTGEFYRTRWSDMMRFTRYDLQNEDWLYKITWRDAGGDYNDRVGKRNHITKKWSGCAKKEGQIGTPGATIEISPNGRRVYLLDLERIMPARHHPVSIYNKVRSARAKRLDKHIALYLSYILENKYSANALGGIGERQIYTYNSLYSSFNSASGEDVLTNLLIDIVNAEDNSLILIEEIEIGLHPTIQRRLMDVLFFESSSRGKQFVVTSHSPAIISSVKSEARILLRKMPDDTTRVIEDISINGALSTMDSESYPLLSIYVEDDISHRLVQEGLQGAMEIGHPGLRKIVRIVEVGSADKTYNYFKARQATDEKDNLKRGFACIIDGDKRNLTLRDGSLQFPPEEGLFFHYSNEAPERMLLREFVKTHPNANLQYHVDDGNAHNLMQKIVDEGFYASIDLALTACIDCLKNSQDGNAYFQDMAQFILNSCNRFMSKL